VNSRRCDPALAQLKIKSRTVDGTSDVKADAPIGRVGPPVHDASARCSYRYLRMQRLVEYKEDGTPYPLSGFFFLEVLRRSGSTHTLFTWSGLSSTS